MVIGSAFHYYFSDNFCEEASRLEKSIGVIYRLFGVDLFACILCLKPIVNNVH